MKYVFIIFSVFLFSLSVISCSSEDGDSSTTSSTSSTCSSSSISTSQLARSSNDYANGVAIDSSGNVYVAGGTYGGLDGNSGSGGNDFFVVKYNSSGTKQWTKQLGSSRPD